MLTDRRLCVALLSVFLGCRTSTQPSADASSPAPSGSFEPATLTAEQAAAIGGYQTVRWEQQGFTFRVPPGWSKARDEQFYLSINAPDSVPVKGRPDGSAERVPSLGILISRSAVTDAEAHARAQYEIMQRPEEHATSSRLVDLGGLHGVLIEYAKAPDPNDHSGLATLRFFAARKRGEEGQLVFITILVDAAEFARQRETLLGILLSARAAPPG